MTQLRLQGNNTADGTVTEDGYKNSLQGFKPLLVSKLSLSEFALNQLQIPKQLLLTS